MSRRRLALLTVAAASVTVITIAPSSPASVPTTRYVNNHVTCDNSTTDSIVVPYCEIQAAVDAASSGDTIQVDSGTYTGSTGFVVDVLTVDLTIRGQGQFSTIIDAENARGGVRVVDHSLSLSNLAIRNASVDGSGAGISAYKSTVGAYLSVTDVTIEDGAATYSGGGILVSASDADLLRVIVSGNDVNKSVQVGAGPGGGMQIYGTATVTITDSTFANNTADTDGGAIEVSGGGADLTITRTLFVNNSADNDGGAIVFSNDGSMAVIDSTFDTNSAPTPNNGGGAIYIDEGTMTVSGSTFVSNTSGNHGGAILDVTNGDATITNSTFTENVAGGNGGAIDSGGALNNLTIIGNSADIGGGISDNGFNGLEITNSIVYGNMKSGPTANDCAFTISSNGGNLYGTVSNCTITPDGSDIVGQDPLVSALADNGGPTETMKLALNSPARNAGSNATPGSGSGACEHDDQRGFDRTLDTRCDSGAYEVFECQGHYATILGTNGDDDLSGTSGPDVILGFGGADAIESKGGADVICGGNGPDLIDGGGGKDRIYGGKGGDTLSGDAKNDRLFGEAGGDTLLGGSGKHDKLNGGKGTDTLNGGKGSGDSCAAGETNVKCETILP